MNVGEIGVVLNVNNGEMRVPSFSDFSNGKLGEPQIRCNEIILPKIDSEKNLQLYVQQFKDEKIKKNLMDKMDEMDENHFLKFFHKTLAKEGYKDDYKRFCKKEKIKFAKDWCEKTGIGYE